MENNCLEKFINNFFNELNNKSIPYCILRNYDELPQHVGNDIDILMYKNNIEDFREYVTEIVEYLGWKSICKCYKDEFFTLMCYKSTDKGIETLQLDIWTDLKWRGISWINRDFVLDNRRLVNNFYAPAKGAESAISTIKELMGKGKVPKKYYKKILEYAKIDKENFIKSLVPEFEEIADIIYIKCIEEKFIDINRLGKVILRKLIKSNPSKYIFNSFKNLISKIKDIFEPKGKLIAFVGPDGSGKTTIIQKEEKYLEKMFNGVKIYHMGYKIFPELKTGYGLSSMKGKVNKAQDSSQNKDKKIKRSTISILASWFVVLYYTLEYIIGGLKVINLKRKGTLILYDRYYYDFFTQPTTRDIIWPFRGILQRLVIKPDVIIHLNADAEVVYKRKQELKVNEIKAQNEYLINLFKTNCNAYSILTDIKDADEISVEVFYTIINHLNGNIGEKCKI